MANLSKANLLNKKYTRVVTLVSMITKNTPLKLEKGGSVVVKSLNIDGKEYKANTSAATLVNAIENLKSPNFKMYDVAGNEYHNGLLLKSEEFKSGGEMGERKAYNKGDMAEGIFGAAVAARFINKNQRVSPSDVEKVLRKLSANQTKQVLKFDSPNRNPKIKDKVIFTLGLALNNMKALTDPSIRKLKDIQDVVNAACSYANGITVTQWSKEVYENNSFNEIHVLSDGLEDQTGTKVDVRVMISNHDGEMLPVNINVSLKAGDVKQFGQMGGSNFETFQDFFKDLFGITITELRNRYDAKIKEGDLKGAISEVYKGVEPKVTKLLSQDDKKTLKHFADAIQWHATRNEEYVTLVQLNRGQAKIYTFDNLFKTFDALSPIKGEYKRGQERGTGKPGLPQIDFMTKDGTTLIRLRVKGGDYRADGSPYFRNIIEKLDGLGKLIAKYADE